MRHASLSQSVNTEPTSRSLRSVAEGLCALAPLGVIALYVLLALYSRAWMGHWPRYYEYLTVYDAPAFKWIGGAFLLWGALSLLFVPVLWAVLRWRAQSRTEAVRHVFAYIAAWTAFVLLAAADPYGFTSFLID